MLHKEKECLRRGIAFVLVGTTDAAEKLVSTTWLSLLKAHICWKEHYYYTTYHVNDYVAFTHTTY